MSLRSVGACSRCGEIVYLGTGEATEGMCVILQRSAGGANAVRYFRPSGRVWHQACWVLHATEGEQLEMFPTTTTTTTKEH